MSLSAEILPAQQLVDELNFQLQQLEDGQDTSDTLKAEASRGLNSLGHAVTRLHAGLNVDNRAMWKP